MALAYLQSPLEGPVRQAEILGNLVEFRPRRVTWGVDGAVNGIDWEGQPRALAVVMTQDCDLEQDYNLRFPNESEPLGENEVEQHPNALQAITLCEAHNIDELASRLPESYGRAEKRLARKNQYERYHCLDEGMPLEGDSIPGLVLDLRTPFAMPAAILYGQLEDDGSPGKRVGIIPEVYSHDLMHRFYSYHARVALPLSEAHTSAPGLDEADAQAVPDELARISSSAQT